MSLEQLFQSMERRVFDLGRKLWPSDPAIAWREEAEELSRELHDRQTALDKKRHEAKTLRLHVLKQEVRATMMASQIESCVFTGDQAKAWEHALELDQTREALQQERQQLSSVESVCRHLERAIHHRERRLAVLQDKLCEFSRLPTSL
jgi:chromosome segregation ATPase